MRKGTQFGVFFRPFGVDALPGMPARVRYVTRFPVPAGPPGAAPQATAESEIDCLVGLVCTALYTLEQPWEMIPGAWHFEVYAGEKRIMDETINVISETK
jgi:hypothetical protein